VCLTRARSADANCCYRCGRPYDLHRADRADKSATGYQARLPGTAERYEALAGASCNPAERVAWQAEADKVRLAQGTQAAHTAQLMMKASGAGSVREAWLNETNPAAREVLRAAMYDNGGRP
jgi:hypothetical protein